MKKILNNKTLRFRLDKTVPGGKYVKKPKCNIACTWCHLDYFNNKEFAAINNVDFYNIIKRAIDVTSSKNASIRFAGSSDPTLAGVQELEDLIQKLDFISQVSRISMTTNGILLGGMINRLEDAGLSDVTISLNSLTRDGYIKYAQRDKLNAVLDSIEMVLNTHIPLKINMLYTKINENEINAFEELSSKNNGIPIKVIDLLQTNGKNSLYLPLEDLYAQIKEKIVDVCEEEWPYKKTKYTLKSGAVFIFKSSTQKNNCSNLNCAVRDKCTEGCRHSIRIGLDGLLKPCGVRNDNTLQCLDEQVSNNDIIYALTSGGKLSYENILSGNDNKPVYIRQVGEFT